MKIKAGRMVWVLGTLICMILIYILSGCIANPSQEPSAEIVANKFLENSDNLTAYRLNATVAIFQYPDFHTYHLKMYGLRPDRYYIEWSDPDGNTTDVFIVNGTIYWNMTFWRILPAKKESYYSSPFPPYPPNVPMNDYDIVKFVSELTRNNRDTLEKNSTIEEDETTYGIEFHAPYYAGMPNCTVILAIDRQTFLPDRMRVYGSTGSLQQEIMFDDLDINSTIPAGLFDYTPPEDFHITSDLFNRPYPLDPLYYSSLNIGSGKGMGGPLIATPVTTTLPADNPDSRL
jgi:outer membrane lipoprotein-sorting protein